MEANQVDTTRMRLTAMALENALEDLDGGDIEAARESVQESRDDLEAEFGV